MRKWNREAVAHHEAGHAIAAWTLGVKIKSVTIIPTADAGGVMTHDNPLRGIRLDVDGSDRARVRAERSIVVCLAGPLAQRKYAPRSVRSWHAASDHSLAVDLAMRVNGSTEMTEAHLKWLGIWAKSLIDNRWRFVETVAGALLERGTLSGTEVREVIFSRTALYSVDQVEMIAV